MIRELSAADDRLVMEYLKRETIINYFIILSLERSVYEEMFSVKWGEFNDEGELIAVMFKRKTGNVQFYSRSNYDVKGFIELIDRVGFNKLIGEESILGAFRENYFFKKEEMGPFIGKLESYINYYDVGDYSSLKRLEIRDIDRVIKLYEMAFKGFATKKSMVEKLENGTGRGYYIESDTDNEIIAVAQTSYEDKASALITGVAVHPSFRKRGLASICLSKLISELTKEGKELYLQYDNEEAGSIYRKLGFFNIGRMVFYYKNEPA